VTRDEHLDEVTAALRPVGDLLLKTRMGVSEQFNPLVIQISLEYAKVHALAAVAASGMAVSGEVLELSVAGPTGPVAQQEPAADPAADHGLIVPQRSTGYL